MTDTTAAYPPFTHPVPDQLQGTLPQTVLVADACRALVAAGVPDRVVALAFSAAKISGAGDTPAIWVRPDVGVWLYRPVLQFAYLAVPDSPVMVPAVTVLRATPDGQERPLLTLWATGITGYNWTFRPGSPEDLHRGHHADGRDALVVALTNAQRGQSHAF
jgi:hypothetical protein